MTEFRLTGPRGDNPLGFLTALGALATLEDARYSAALGWEAVRPRLVVGFDRSWGASPEGEEERRRFLVDELCRLLRRNPEEGAKATEQARKAMEGAKTALKKKQKEVRRRKLHREARRRELEPLEKDLRDKEETFKQLLIRSAADPTVSLGKNLTATNTELIGHLLAALKQCSVAERRWADLVAAYGLADPAEPGERMLSSPWALVSGSGHQNFLSSIEQLMLQCQAEHLKQALFGPWEGQEEKHSLRLDPAEDRRYALMDGDPTGGKNKPKTLWGANRLAFEALRFFPAMPLPGGMGVRGWSAQNGNWQDGCRVRWPLWGPPVSAAVAHSLLGLRDLWSEDPEARARLQRLGVHAVMECRRIAVGQGPNRKFNLTPATPVWVSASRLPGTQDGTLR